ncbi:karyopherin beta [Allomyces javanicus]|nr:karyopherin beta [Allomyces javanicus]
MNIGEWLAGSISADQRVREESERNLEAAYNSDYTTYIGLLTQELVNPNAAGHVRTSAGLAIKNALTGQEASIKESKTQKWLAVDPTLRRQIKTAILGNLDSAAGGPTAQVIAAIAAMDLPRNDWPELMQQLLANMTSGTSSENLKVHSMTAIGYTCELIDASILATQSDNILTAVVNGARKDEPSARVRKQALDALANSLVFVKANFEREAERNIIMQVVCEATQAPEVPVQIAAYQCLIKIVDLYYKYMELYLKKALYGVTIFSMQSGESDVALQAIEFWNTVCEREYDLLAQAEEDAFMGRPTLEPCLHFTKNILKELVPVLFWLLSQKDEDDDDDDWTPAMAAGTCLSLVALTVGHDIVPHALPLIEANLRSVEWRQREAAVMTFGAILEGPNAADLAPLVKQALPFLLDNTVDLNAHVKDTAVWTLGRVCEFMLDHLDHAMRESIVAALVRGLTESPRIAASCCWALNNFGEHAVHLLELDEQTAHAVAALVEPAVTGLIQVSARADNANNVRSAAYVALGTWVSIATPDRTALVLRVCEELLRRLEASLGTQYSAAAADLQANLCLALAQTVRRLGADVAQGADRVMDVLIRVVTMASTSKAAAVLEDAWTAVAAVATALETGFMRFMPVVLPLLVAALNNYEERAVCPVAVGVVADLTRALDGEFLAFADGFMEVLGNLLVNAAVSTTIKPSIITCFGDIALAVGTHFEKYLTVVMGVLAQAIAMVKDPAAPNAAASPETVEFIELMREAIVDALVGIVAALAPAGKGDLLIPYLDAMCTAMHAAASNLPQDPEHVVRQIAGLVGDLAANIGAPARLPLSQPWVPEFLTMAARTRSFETGTRETAKWARMMVKDLARAG